jgi:hypothetical protein
VNDVITGGWLGGGGGGAVFTTTVTLAVTLPYWFDAVSV